MKIAIRQATRRSLETLERFPTVLIAGAACMVLGLLAIEDTTEDRWLRPLLTATIGLPLLFALAINGERRRWSAGGRWVVGLAGMAVLVVFWAASRGWSEVVLMTRFVQVNLAAHLLVAFLPFVRAGTLNGFWQYNRSLFLRFLLAGLYTFVLYVGLVIALVAVENLFSVNVPDRSFLRLAVVLAFVFNPWFFLAGVPADLDALDRVEDYPIGLKVFTQFVLIPLVSVYIVILTAYLVRVIVTQTWPSGWIGWLVSSVAAAGTLALLLVHPIRERADSRWVDGYARWFYVALLPSIAMLLMAIWQRIDQYAITENRYFLLIGSVWLTGIALFYAITASRNIRVIPMSLCLITGLTLAGPWSAYAVSRNSQIERFRSILRRNEMLADGQIQRPPAQVSSEDRRELSAVLRYLHTTHGIGALARIDPMLADTTRLASSDSLANADDRIAALALDRLGLAYISRWEVAEPGRFFDTRLADGIAIDVSGFETMHRVNLVMQNTLDIGGDTLVIGPIDGTTVPIRWRGVPAIAIALDSAIAGLGPGPTGGRPARPIVLDGETAGLRVRLVISQIAGNRTDAGITIGSASADLITGRR